VLYLKNAYVYGTKCPFVYCLFISFSGKGQSGSAVVITVPVEYNDYIVEQQNKIGSEMKVFIGVLTDELSTKSEALTALDKLNETISLSTITIENLKQIDPDFGLKTEALNLFKFYSKTISTSYLKLLDELYAETPDLDKMNQLMTQITEEEAIYDNAYKTAQEKFAAQNNFVLEANTLMDEE